MSKLDRFMTTSQRTADEMLAEIEELLAEMEPGRDGLCPNRDWCLPHRLNVSLAAIEDGWRCGFEERHHLWQCHLSGIVREEKEA